MDGLGCVCVVCVGVFPEKYAIVSRVSLGHVCLCVGCMKVLILVLSPFGV